MTYSCTNPDDLHEVVSKVEELIISLKGKLPKSEGLVLRPEARKRARQRAQKICRKYRPIPNSVRRGRYKKDWRYRNRVGRKANELRKVISTIMCIYLLHGYIHTLLQQLLWFITLATTEQAT